MDCSTTAAKGCCEEDLMFMGVKRPYQDKLRRSVVLVLVLVCPIEHVFVCSVDTPTTGSTHGASLTIWFST